MVIAASPSATTPLFSLPASESDPVSFFWRWINQGQTCCLDAWEKWRNRWLQADPRVEELDQMALDNLNPARIGELLSEVRSEGSPLAHALRRLFRRTDREELDLLLSLLTVLSLRDNKPLIIDRAVALIPLEQIRELSDLIRSDMEQLQETCQKILRYQPRPDATMRDLAEKAAKSFLQLALVQLRHLLDSFVLSIELPEWDAEIDGPWQAKRALSNYYHWINFPATIFTAIFSVTGDHSQSLIATVAITLIGGITLFLYHNYLRPRPNKLAHFTSLNEKAKQGLYEGLLERRTLTDQLASNLSGSKDSMRQVLLVGGSGVGKSALVEALAHRIVNGSVDPGLKNKQIFSVDTDHVSSSTVRRCNELIGRIGSYADDYLFFIDEIHALSEPEKHSPAIQALKPILARGDLHIIGATTEREFKLLENEPEFLSRFTIIHVDGMDENETRTLLQNYWKKQAPTIPITSDGWEEMLQASRIEGTNFLNPRTAMDLINRAIQKVNLSRESHSEQLTDLQRQHTALSLAYAQECMQSPEHDRELLDQLERLDHEICCVKARDEEQKKRIQPLETHLKQKPFWEKKYYETVALIAGGDRSEKLAALFALLRHQLLPQLNTLVDRHLKQAEGFSVIDSALVRSLRQERIEASS